MLLWIMNLHFNRYEPEIKRLTKVNSLLVNGRLFYIVKKDNTGKAVKCFCVYDYKTKVQIGFYWDKTTIEDNLIKVFKKERIYDILDLFFEKVNK